MAAPVLQSLLLLSARPVPSATIADMLQICQGQRFDDMGVISCTKQRDGVLTKGGPRTVVDVDLSDGSKTGDNVTSMRVAAWLPPGEQAFSKQLQECHADGACVAFFGLYGALDAGGSVLNVSCSSDWWFCKAEGR